MAAPDDRALHVGAALAIRRVDDDVRAVSQKDACGRLLVADVEPHGPAVRGLAVEARREHLEAELDRLPADLGAEVAGTAGDEELHPRTIVTGPSFTSSTAIRAPKTPCSTGTPSARSSAQKRS